MPQVKSFNWYLQRELDKLNWIDSDTYEAAELEALDKYDEANDMAFDLMKERHYGLID